MAEYRLSISVDIVTDEPMESEDFSYLAAASLTNWIDSLLHQNEVIDPELVKVEKISS